MTKLSLDTYNHFKAKEDNHSSWAVWADETDKPSSNIGDLSIFDEETILDVLNPNIVLVAFSHAGPDRDNIRDVYKMKSFQNFHGSKNDARLRFALKGTPLWGAYMTDIIKTIAHSKVAVVKKKLKENPGEEELNIDLFLEELKELKVEKKPILIALGAAVHDMLEKHSNGKLSKFRIEKIMHFSAQGKWQVRETYRDRVHQEIKDVNLS